MDQTIDLILDGEERPSAAMRLIYTAGPLFAERPFDSVSTRELAKAANVNLSAISYHFGSKAGLYQAILETIVDELAPVRAQLTKSVDEGLKSAQTDPELLANLLGNFVETIIRVVMAKENPRWRINLAVREMQHPSEFAPILIDGHVNKMHSIVGRLVARIKGRPETDPEILLLTHTVMLSCLQFGLNETFICNRMGWEEFGTTEINEIIGLMQKTILNMVGYTDAK